MGGTPPAYTQNSFRVRSEDTVVLNANGGADWAAAENIDVTIDGGRRFRIRFHFEETVGKGGPEGFQLQALHPEGSNSWETLVVDGGSTLAPAIPRVSNQFTDGDAATEVLTNQGSTYEDGEGDTNNSASSSPDATETECEWCILIPRYYYIGSTLYSIDDGDTIQFRVVLGDDTAFDVYSNTPTITVNHFDKWLGGSYGKTLFGVGPHIDSSGNQYQLQEYCAPWPLLAMMKSTDGGITWSPVDEINLPTEGDWAGACSVATDTHIHILHHTGTDVVYHQFAMSAAGSNPDTWRTTDESLESTITAGLQVGSLVVRSTEIVAVYQMLSGGNDGVYYKKRNSLGDTGTWDTTGTEIDATASVDFYAPSAVKEIGSNIVHIFYKDNTNGDIWHKSLNASDTLSGRELVEGNAGTAISRQVAMTNAVAWQDGADEYVMVAVQDISNDFLYSVTIKNDASPGTRRAAASEDVEHDNSGSRAPQAALCVNGKDIHLLFAQDVGGDIYITKSVNDAAWDAPIGLETGVERKCNNISGLVHTHNGGNGGATVVAYTWDDHVGDGSYTGDIWYNEYEVTAPSVPILKYADETISIDSGLVRLAGLLRIIDEAISVPEVIARAFEYVKLIPETVNSSEAINSFRSLIRTITTEVVNIPEAISYVRGLLRTISDTVSISETIESVISRLLTKIIDEVASIPETASAAVGFVKAIVETVSIDESISSARDLVRAISEAVNVSESILAARNLVRTVFETISIGEVPARLLSLIRAVPETVNVAENVLRFRELVRTLAETVSIPEAASKAVGFVKAISEAVNIQETAYGVIATAGAIIKVISENIGVNEIIQTARDIVTFITESVNVPESATANRILLRVVSEIVQVSETISRYKFIRWTISETQQVVESVQRRGTFNRVISEAVNVVENISRLGVIIKTITENVSIQETIIHKVAEFLAAIDKSKFKSMFKGAFKRMQ